MPWLETAPMDQRSRFIDAYRAGGFTMTELCARFQVSRRVGYKWVARYDAEGRKGLADRSRAPHRCPHKVPDEVVALLCQARRKHTDWGPEKLMDWLRPKYPRVSWPAISTASDVLKRAGLIKPRRRRYRATHPGVVPPTMHAPNDLWTADLKGQFRTGDGEYCYPLTVADLHARYLLACQGLRSTQTLAVHYALRTALPRVRPASGDSHRQRRAVRDDGTAWAVHPQRVVDAAGHSAPADSACLAAAKRRARTHAQDAEARRHSSRATDARQSATRVQQLPDRVQRRAPAPESQRRDAELVLSPLAAAVSDDPAAYRVSQPLPREAHHRRGDVPPGGPALLPEQRSASLPRRLGGNRRWAVVTLLLPRAPRSGQ